MVPLASGEPASADEVKGMSLLRVRRGGFTLVELLVVIAIITVLIAIGLPVMSRVREKTKQASCMANLMQIQQALRLYRLDEGGYPSAYDPVTGQGGLNALYPTHIASRKVFICPDDDIEDGQAYATAPPFRVQGQYPADPYATLLYRAGQMYYHNEDKGYYGYPWRDWSFKTQQPVDSDESKTFFQETYSSYNLLYNWIGYTWWDMRAARPTYRVTPDTMGVSWPTGWADNIAFWYKWYWWDPKGELGVVRPTTEGGFERPGNQAFVYAEHYLASFLAQQIYWSGYGYQPSNPNPDDATRVKDSLKRWLWDADLEDPAMHPSGIPSAVFPGLINHNAPENTIITRCPNHRRFTKNADIALRLDGTSEIIPGPEYANYDWAVQPKQSP
jgi:prepilin-type N-terminal cleavage/methylation domain-containing protein